MKTKTLFKVITVVTLTLVSACMLAQDTTDVVIPIVEGQTPLDFLKDNAWSLALIAYSLLEFWLGKTGWVKEGSMLAVVINWIGKLIFGKAKVLVNSKMENTRIYQAKKDAAMQAKKRREFPHLPIILIIGLALSVNSVSAQSPWGGFWKPVDDNMFLLGTDGEAMGSEWLFRPEVYVSAMKFTPADDKSKVFDVSALTSAGLGIGYQHYVESNGQPYNNYGFNVLLLFDAVPTETSPAGVSLAGTVSALRFISVGAGYDFGAKSYFLLSGVVISF